jgi:hypothetical protein
MLTLRVPQKLEEGAALMSQRGGTLFATLPGGGAEVAVLEGLGPQVLLNLLDLLVQKYKYCGAAALSLRRCLPGGSADVAVRWRACGSGAAQFTQFTQITCCTSAKVQMLAAVRRWR